MNPLKYKFLPFYEEADDNHGGSAKEVLGEITPEPTSEVTPDPKEATPEVAPFDAKAMAAEFGEHLKGYMPKAPAEQAKAPMTAEEAKKMLNFFDIDEDFMTQFGNLDTQKTALERMRDGITKHVDTVMQARLQQAQSNVDSQYAPLLTAHQQQQVEAQESRFFKTHEQLNNPALRPILAAVGNSLDTSQFKDEKSLFTAIASGVEAVIQQTNPEFKLAAASAVAGKPVSKQPTLPVTTPGGGGGGGGAGDSVQGQSKAMGILGKV